MAAPGVHGVITGDARPLIAETQRADNALTRLASNFQKRFSNLRANLPPNFGHGIQDVEGKIGRLERTSGKLLTTLDRMSRTFTAGLGLGAVAGGLMLVERMFDRMVTKARSYQTAVLSISAARASAFDIVGAKGTKFSGPDANPRNAELGFQRSKADASRINKLLIERASKNILTYEEQLQSFLVSTPIAAKKGLSEQQQRTISEYLAVAAKTLGLRGQQIANQVRVVLSGQNIPRSTLGSSLGLDNSIKKLEGKQYYDTIINKVKGFLAGQKDFEGSIEGIIAQLESTADIALAKGGQKLFPQLKPFLDELQTNIKSGDMDKVMDNIVSIFVNAAKAVNTFAHSPAIPIIRNFIEFLANHGDKILLIAGLSKLLGFLTSVRRRAIELKGDLVELGLIKAKNLESDAVSAVSTRRTRSARNLEEAVDARGRAVAQRGGVTTGGAGMRGLPGTPGTERPMQVWAFDEKGLKAPTDLKREEFTSRRIATALERIEEKGGLQPIMVRTDFDEAGKIKAPVEENLLNKQYRPRPAQENEYFTASDTAGLREKVRTDFIVAQQARADDLERAQEHRSFVERQARLNAITGKIAGNANPTGFAGALNLPQAATSEGMRGYSKSMFINEARVLGMTAALQRQYQRTSVSFAERAQNVYGYAGPRVMPALMNAGMAYMGTSLANNYYDQQPGRGAKGMGLLSRVAGYGAQGAMIGSIFPGIGTSVGAIAGGLFGIADSFSSMKTNADKAQKEAEQAGKEVAAINPLVARYMKQWEALGADSAHSRIKDPNLRKRLQESLDALFEAATANIVPRQQKEQGQRLIDESAPKLQANEGVFGLAHILRNIELNRRVKTGQIDLGVESKALDPREEALNIGSRAYLERTIGAKGSRHPLYPSDNGYIAPEVFQRRAEAALQKQEARLSSDVESKKARLEMQQTEAGARGYNLTTSLLDLQGKLLEQRKLYPATERGQADFESMARSSIQEASKGFKDELYNVNAGLRDLHVEAKRLSESFSDTEASMRRSISAAKYSEMLGPVNLLKSDNPLRKAIETRMEDERDKLGMSLLRKRFPDTFGISGAISGPLPPPPPAQGLLNRGNIDLYRRPIHKNPDGSMSTVRSMSFDENGKEVLIPTISPSGKLLSDAQAMKLYRKTGQHLGKFDSIEHANAYAIALHKQQEELYKNGSPFDPKNLMDFSQGDFNPANQKRGFMSRIGRALAPKFGAASRNESENDMEEASSKVRDAVRKHAQFIEDSANRFADLAHNIGVVSDKAAKIAADFNAAGKAIVGAIDSFRLKPIKADIRNEIQIAVTNNISKALSDKEVEDMVMRGVRDQYRQQQEQNRRDMDRAIYSKARPQE